MKDNNVTALIQPEEFKDQLTEILRQGARNLIVQADQGCGENLASPWW